MNKTYFGNYLGIVVANNDPEQRGRVKVWVPHVSAVIYKNWNAQIQDKNFVFLGKDNPDIENILPDLKATLPWAECAIPLFGGSASGRYNAYTQTGTKSDANYWENGKLVEGVRPAQMYVGTNAYPDAFEETNKNNNRFTNPYAYQYTPSNYSTAAKGLYTIPNVGAHIWVFFVGGDPNCPVYFAASSGKEDWTSIYQINDYPKSFENYTKAEQPELNQDVMTFRSKTVFNSNKHTIELIDTDNHEILKMTHYSGSFKEFNNYANIELATNNDQKMVLGHQFLTVQKNQSIYVAMNQEVIIAGDQYTTIGNAKTEDVKKIVDKLKELHEYKKLFDVQRTDRTKPPGDVSKYQQKAGTFTICPVCKGLPYVPNLSKMGQLAFLYPSIYVYSTMFNAAAKPVPPGAGQIGIYKGVKCNVCNGTGLSPSTQEGIWTPDPLKESQIINLLTSNAKQMTELERKLGEGDQIIDIVKNKVETIGTVMNDMKSFRTDPIGKLRIDGVFVATEGTYSTFKPSPHVEYVDVDDVPGGDYNLTACNKYKLLVGAKGINIKTFGPIDMYGTLINMTGEQVNISSQNEVLIDGGERFSIRARKVSLIPVEHNPVVVEGQLHVTRNAVVGGGMFVNGELGVTHITCTYEYYQTEYGGTSVTTLPVGDGMSHVHMLAPHTHWYKHIPVGQFLPSYDAVRDYMIQKGINSTSSLAYAGSQTRQSEYTAQQQAGTFDNVPAPGSNQSSGTTDVAETDESNENISNS